MKRGFTIIELLVASLLLGMLVTILTMIFNQSSIAWRTGIAGVSDMSDVRSRISRWREEADNVFVANNRAHLIISLWKTDDDLRTRACDLDDSQEEPEAIDSWLNDSTTLANMPWLQSVGAAKSAVGGKNYIVNVMSAGPDREFDTWDDIWSWPDEFE